MNQQMITENSPDALNPTQVPGEVSDAVAQDSGTGQNLVQNQDQSNQVAEAHLDVDTEKNSVNTFKKIKDGDELDSKKSKRSKKIRKTQSEESRENSESQDLSSEQNLTSEEQSDKDRQKTAKKKRTLASGVPKADLKDSTNSAQRSEDSSLDEIQS